MAKTGFIKKTHVLWLACAVVAILTVGYVVCSYAFPRYSYTGIVSSVEVSIHSSETIVTMQNGHVFYINNLASLQIGKQYTLWYNHEYGKDVSNYFMQVG
jgi:hypothetical protein